MPSYKTYKTRWTPSLYLEAMEQINLRVKAESQYHPLTCHFSLMNATLLGLGVTVINVFSDANSPRPHP